MADFVAAGDSPFSQTKLTDILLLVAEMKLQLDDSFQVGLCKNKGNGDIGQRADLLLQVVRYDMLMVLRVDCL